MYVQIQGAIDNISRVLGAAEVLGLENLENLSVKKRNDCYVRGKVARAEEESSLSHSLTHLLLVLQVLLQDVCRLLHRLQLRVQLLELGEDLRRE